MSDALSENGSDICPTPFACTPAEIKLLLRLRQVRKTGAAVLVMLDLSADALHVIGKAEHLSGKSVDKIEKAV
ncbi:MAG TPA: hypothetical protein PKD55_09685 [Bellilinea sp.]|nr:hypothetical protein [Bellilinea sp.]